MIEFPINKYGSDLLASLWHYRYEVLSDNDQMALNLLYKVLKAKVFSENKRESVWNIQLSVRELLIVENNKWQMSGNLEVCSRFKDITLRSIRVNKQMEAEKLAQQYLNLYERTVSSEFILRSFELISSFHISNEILMNLVLEKIYSVSSYWFVSFSKILYKSKIVKNKDFYIKKIEELRNKCAVDKQFIYERNYIEALFNLKQFDIVEFHHQKALSFENEALNLIATETEDEIHMEIENILSDSYREIYVCRKKHAEDYKRIMKEYNNRKLRMAQWLDKYGVKFNYSESNTCVTTTRLLLNSYVVRDFKDIIALFFKFPFLSTKRMNEVLDEQMSKHVL